MDKIMIKKQYPKILEISHNSYCKEKLGLEISHNNYCKEKLGLEISHNNYCKEKWNFKTHTIVIVKKNKNVVAKNIRKDKNVVTKNWKNSQKVIKLVGVVELVSFLTLLSLRVKVYEKKPLIQLPRLVTKNRNNNYCVKIKLNKTGGIK
jgi:hypothetical protein